MLLPPESVFVSSVDGFVLSPGLGRGFPSGSTSVLPASVFVVSVVSVVADGSVIFVDPPVPC